MYRGLGGSHPLFQGLAKGPVAENHSGINFDRRLCLSNVTIELTGMKKNVRKTRVEKAGHRSRASASVAS